MAVACAAGGKGGPPPLHPRPFWGESFGYVVARPSHSWYDSWLFHPASVRRRIMSRHEGLSQWTTCVSTNLPHLSKPQATVLALWSFGITCTRSSGRLTAATFLALLLGWSVAAVEQRLYDWCLNASDKAGGKRAELDVTLCFVPLLGWIVGLWSSTQIALTLDATSLGDQFVVLAICV